MRVLQGVTGQAGQPHALSRGLRAIGVHAETCYIQEHRFSYPGDTILPLDGTETLETAWMRIAPLVERFDVFHFHARSFLANWPQAHYPAGLDIALLKLAGRKVFFHFRGQEARLAAQFAAMNPYHYVDDASGYLFRKMPDSTKLRLRDYIVGMCDGVFVTDPELQTYVPGAAIVPRALDGADLRFVGISDRARPTIVHAPSRRGVKGTDHVISACRQLQSEGLNFDLRLVENVSHEAAIAAYRDADIVVDQLRIGWYGVLAVEAMALGKPVVAYMRPDLPTGNVPVVNANPDTLTEALRKLVIDRETRQKLAHEGRAYFDRVHDSVAVAKVLASHYSAPSRPADPVAFARFLDGGSRDVAGVPAPLNNNVRSRVRHFVDIARSEGIGKAIALTRRFVKRRLGKR